MRVICIDDSPGKKSGAIPPFKYGDIVEAIDCLDCNCCYQIDKKDDWHKSRFIPLSTIDETEMIRETNLQKS